MFNIVLVEPEIPQNTGNIVRTCAATGCRLHLVRPLGFEVSDKYLKRAGLDYWHFVDISYYDSVGELFAAYPQGRFWFFSTKAAKTYSDIAYEEGDFLVFGKETKGLPRSFWRRITGGACACHGGGDPFAESFQFRRRRRLRGVAAARLQRRAACGKAARRKRIAAEG